MQLYRPTDVETKTVKRGITRSIKKRMRLRKYRTSPIGFKSILPLLKLARRTIKVTRRLREKKKSWLSSLIDHWCRRGESNRRAMLKSRKLLILRIARNAKNAKNVFHDYAAVTRSAAKGFRAGRNRWYAKLYFEYEDQLSAPYRSPLFPKEFSGLCTSADTSAQVLFCLLARSQRT
jgi:hypothetical protein